MRPPVSNERGKSGKRTASDSVSQLHPATKYLFVSCIGLAFAAVVVASGWYLLNNPNLLHALLSCMA